MLGFPYDGFYSTDYFPLIPWIFLFFSGYFTWQLILWAALLRQKAAERYALLRNASAGRSIPASSVRLPLLEKPKCQPLEFLGKNTLPVYMLHQPVLMAIFTLIDLIGVL